MFIQQTVTKMGSRTKKLRSQKKSTKHAPFQQTGGFGTDPVVGLYQHGAPFLAVVKHVETRLESPFFRVHLEFRERFIDDFPTTTSM